MAARKTQSQLYAEAEEAEEAAEAAGRKQQAENAKLAAKKPVREVAVKSGNGVTQIIAVEA